MSRGEPEVREHRLAYYFKWNLTAGRIGPAQKVEARRAGPKCAIVDGESARVLLALLVGEGRPLSCAEDPHRSRGPAAQSQRAESSSLRSAEGVVEKCRLNSRLNWAGLS